MTREIKFRAWDKHSGRMLDIDDELAITLDGSRLMTKDEDNRNKRDGEDGWGFDGGSNHVKIIGNIYKNKDLIKQ